MSDYEGGLLTCPICGEWRGLTPNICHVTNVWKKVHSVQYCGLCKTYFLHDMPDFQELRDYYAYSYYDHSALKDHAKRIFRKARCNSQALYLSQQIECHPKAVLEVGAGDGMLLGIFKQKGAYVEGIEYNRRYLDHAKLFYNISLTNCDYFDQEGQFNLIIMSHVFEHFVNVKDVLKKTNDLLFRKGYLFLELPNSPMPNEVSSSTLKSYLNTTHTYNFSMKSFSYLVDNSDFDILDISRYEYNIGSRHQRRPLRDLSMAVLTGKMPEPASWPALLKYCFLCMHNPEKSFVKIRDGEKWHGFGDNIRLLIRKK